MLKAATVTRNIEAPALKVARSCEEYAAGVWGRRLLVVFRTQIGNEGMNACSQLFGQLRQAQPQQRFGVVVLIEARCALGAAFPEPEVAAAALRRASDALSSLVRVYECEGFVSALLRARTTTIHGGGKLDVPYATYASLRDAQAWLREVDDDASLIDPAALPRVFEQLRAAPY